MNKGGEGRVSGMIYYRRGEQPTAHGRIMPTSNSCVARQAPRGKQINKVEYYVTFAGVVGAAPDKNQNSFSSREGCPHHCTISISK